MGMGYCRQLTAAAGDVYPPARRGEAHRGWPSSQPASFHIGGPVGQCRRLVRVGQRTSRVMGTSAFQCRLNEFNGRRKRLARGVCFWLPPRTGGIALHRGALAATSRALFCACPVRKPRCSIVALGALAHRPCEGEMRALSPSAWTVPAAADMALPR